MSVRALVVGVGGVGAAVAVCWSLFAPAEVTRDQVESGTLSQVADAPSDALNCEGGLRAEVGAAQSCTLIRGDEKFSVNLTVTDVDGERVSWDSVVAGAPESGQRVPVAELEIRTREVLARERPVEVVTCNGALPGVVGAVQDCTMTSRGARHAVLVEVATVTPDHVRWGVTVTE
ncbi:DUF4333 domain-containing protein [Tsukamurella sp. PLM1]|uniref:DUF4333 domain-containing protein n=1 Tax=Tsukamurella sp. PLM1 TaxID=2929795 RepID=UPI002064E750|nr:DUF4333 domain-containing protein [Tsukamurella sp. PLM1]BDH55868.1 hypothetical protein MTP03_08070 [Tsukamurella sp. PLM1]